MSIRNYIVVALICAVVVAPVAAREPTQSLPTVTAEVAVHTVDCQHRVLPSQRAVGEWTGQHNFSQVYTTRQRLMAEVGRSCRKAGIAQVQIVSQVRSASSDLRVAAVDIRRSN